MPLVIFAQKHLRLCATVLLLLVVCIASRAAAAFNPVQTPCVATFYTARFSAVTPAETCGAILDFAACTAALDPANVSTTRARLNEDIEASQLDIDCSEFTTSSNNDARNSKPVQPVLASHAGNLQVELDAGKDVTIVRRAAPESISIMGLSDRVKALSSDTERLRGDVSSAVSQVEAKIDTASAAFTQATRTVVQTTITDATASIETLVKRNELATNRLDTEMAVVKTDVAAVKGEVANVPTQVTQSIMQNVYTEAEVNQKLAAQAAALRREFASLAPKSTCPNMKLSSGGMINTCINVKAGESCEVKCSGSLAATGDLVCGGGGAWEYPLPKCVKDLGTERNPAPHCIKVKNFAAIREFNGGSDSKRGIAWIKIPNSGLPAFAMYCDNSVDGGGWGYVVYIDGNDEDHSNVEQVGSGQAIVPNRDWAGHSVPGGIRINRVRYTSKL